MSRPACVRAWQQPAPSLVGTTGHGKGSAAHGCVQQASGAPEARLLNLHVQLLLVRLVC
jgi:hypothetical protein